MILFADEDLLVINKPSGLRSIPDGYIPSLPTVQSELQAEWGRVYIVHRLDKDTSGVMLLPATPNLTASWTASSPSVKSPRFTTPYAAGRQVGKKST